jgi:hypothetical protein
MHGWDTTVARGAVATAMPGVRQVITDGGPDGVMLHPAVRRRAYRPGQSEVMTVLFEVLECAKPMDRGTVDGVGAGKEGRYRHIVVLKSEAWTGPRVGNDLRPCLGCRQYGLMDSGPGCDHVHIGPTAHPLSSTIRRLKPDNSPSLRTGTPLGYEKASVMLSASLLNHVSPVLINVSMPLGSTVPNPDRCGTR